MTDLIAASNAAADAAGIPRVLLLGCAIAESALNTYARRPRNQADDERYWPDVSFGAWQQTVRWADAYIKARSKSGIDPAIFPGSGTIEAIGANFYDPEYAAEYAAANLAQKWARYQPDMLATLCAYNWPAGAGKPASEAVESNYAHGLRDASRLLAATPSESTMPAYDPDAPVDVQEETFDCSQEAAQWGLRALGRTPGEEWLESTMIADGIMSEAHGLLDGTGGDLADWITEQYSEPGPTGPAVEASNNASVSFDDVRSVAGSTPVLIGGHRWNHWTGVRRYDPGNDVLVLANPGGDGPKYGHKTLTRKQFTDLGPFSMVVLRPKGQTHPPPDPPDAQARVRDLVRQIAPLVRELEELTR